jgi:catechol 2,3-dioxygenase-like lactoylglutathione lyase family enzyme
MNTPSADLHHVHIFASDLDASVTWYQQMLGATVAFDGDFGGVRNVFMHVGRGRLNLYEQPPRGTDSGSYHHIGIQTDDLRTLHQRLTANGIQFRSDVREFGTWRYIMCPAPDNVLLELFQIDIPEMPPALQTFFSN